MDAGVVTAVLCSVPDPAAALGELAPRDPPRRRAALLRARRGPLARAWRGCSARSTRRSGRGVNGGCHTHRDTEAAIRAAGFEIEERDRFSFRAHVLAAPVAPRILGRARRIRP